MRASTLGWATAAVALVVDRASKSYLLGPADIEAQGRVAVTPFLDLVMVWNRGVSYGLFAGDSGASRWLLVALGTAGSLLFAWWLRSTTRVLAALSLGLVIGGALSNVIDRVLYGAVADFFLLHAGTFEWYVFNVADVWIVAGAVGLVVTWLTERPEKATEG